MERIYIDSRYDELYAIDTIDTFSEYIPSEIYEQELEELLGNYENYDEAALAKVIEYLPENIRNKFPSKSIDTTFFKVPPFLMSFTTVPLIFNLLNDPNINSETRKKIAEFIEHANTEPGCTMICAEIDKFMKKEFAPGLTMAEKDYEQEMKSYRDEELRLEILLPYSSYECTQDVINEYMSQDREAPYIGILPREISIGSAVKCLIGQEGVIEKIGEDDGTEKIEEDKPNTK